MRELLRLFPRPAHYAALENGAIRKDKSGIALHIALAFPDVYEVGMSYLGQKILYGIVNQREDWWAERVMAPEPEVCAILRERKAPLCSLESDTPLASFDALCFSVTHEVCCNDILNMLDLAGIPLRSAQRPDSLAGCPLVIAGGGAMLGAEPLSPFFDLVALGDGEELLPEILELLQEAKRSGLGRSAFLERARHIPGVYIPAFFKEDANGDLRPLYTDHKPKRRIVADLNDAAYPETQVAPLGAVHNRLSLEIARGCSRGCRFCHAGMIYRPMRERDSANIAKILDNCLKNTGFDEVSFLALSAGDCTALKEIYSQAYGRCQKEQTALCLPSLRVGSVDDEIMAKMADLRRPGATLAPEAGSQRLRDVINKGVSEEDLLLHIRKLLEHGWRQVKLYFMIGLPTETDADLEAIADLCSKARDAGGKGAPRMQVTASIAPFVPKPFTPFQWEAQPDLAEITRRVNFLRDKFKNQKGLRLKWHEPAASHLEGILARGDRRLADVIEKAFRKGAIFCGWNEYFDFAPWQEALAECGLAPQDYIRSRAKDEILPWDHIAAGASREFLWREREKAYAEKITPDCRFGACGQCGACDFSGRPGQLAANGQAGHRLVNKERDQVGDSAKQDENGRLVLRESGAGRPKLDPALARRACQYRLWHLKKGSAAFLSQLELQSVLQRSLRRARVPVAFSQGYHPMPLLSFGRALPVGVESAAEWLLITLHSMLAPLKLAQTLNASLPEDLAIIKAEAWGGKAEQAISETFALEFADADALGRAAASFASFAAEESRMITRETKSGQKTEDIRPLLLNWRILPDSGKQALLFNTDWSDAYLSPLLLARSILGPLVTEGARLVKISQTFQDGTVFANQI